MITREEFFRRTGDLFAGLDERRTRIMHGAITMLSWARAFYSEISYRPPFVAGVPCPDICHSGPIATAYKNTLLEFGGLVGYSRQPMEHDNMKAVVDKFAQCMEYARRKNYPTTLCRKVGEGEGAKWVDVTDYHQMNAEILGVYHLFQQYIHPKSQPPSHSQKTIRENS